MKDFDYTQYRKNNPLLKESLDGALVDYVKAASERCFAGGGNGENLLQYGLPEVAAMIDNNLINAGRPSPEEDGFYTPATTTAFKKFVDSIVKDEIENNNTSRYGAGDDEDTYDFPD
jgi:hypothetical protein